MRDQKNIRELITALSTLPEKELAAVVGLDGFVDEVVHVVNRRIDNKNYDRIETIEAYGRRIANCAGMSSNIEMVVKTRKIGGNGTMLANALGKYGLAITYIGTIGKPVIDPVFNTFPDSAELIGIAEPGKTDAIEFLDGKIISSKLDSLNNVRWEDVKQAIAPNVLADKIRNADLVSFNNWTMIPSMGEIWRGIVDEVLPLVENDIQKKFLFIDIADPEKRDPVDLLNALQQISVFSSYGFTTMLGLNKKEALEIIKALGLKLGDPKDMPLELLVHAIFSNMSIQGLVVHPVDRAALLMNGEYVEVAGPVCANPVITTGAGDHFNAGFTYGFLQGFPAKLCLLLGVATSGYYVRNADAPTVPELLQFLRDWESDALDS